MVSDTHFGMFHMTHLREEDHCERHTMFRSPPDSDRQSLQTFQLGHRISAPALPGTSGGSPTLGTTPMISNLEVPLLLGQRQ